LTEKNTNKQKLSDDAENNTAFAYAGRCRNGLLAALVVARCRGWCCTRDMTRPWRPCCPPCVYTTVTGRCLVPESSSNLSPEVSGVVDRRRVTTSGCCTTDATWRHGWSSAWKLREARVRWRTLSTL